MVQEGGNWSLYVTGETWAITSKGPVLRTSNFLAGRLVQIFWVSRNTRDPILKWGVSFCFLSAYFFIAVDTLSRAFLAFSCVTNREELKVWAAGLLEVRGEIVIGVCGCHPYLIIKGEL